MPPNSTIQPDSITRHDNDTADPPARHIMLSAVADALSRLRYGAVHLTVHDGKVVQLDVTERQRFS
jgi:hypothetical protein